MITVTVDPLEVLIKRKINRSLLIRSFCVLLQRNAIIADGVNIIIETDGEMLLL